MPDAGPTPAAERQRRYRARQRRGVVVAHVEVPTRVIEALIDKGLLPENKATEPWTLGAALVAAVKKLVTRNA